MHRRLLSHAGSSVPNGSQLIPSVARAVHVPPGPPPLITQVEPSLQATAWVEPTSQDVPTVAVPNFTQVCEVVLQYSPAKKSHAPTASPQAAFSPTTLAHL